MAIYAILFALVVRVFAVGRVPDYLVEFVDFLHHLNIQTIEKLDQAILLVGWIR